MVDDLRKMGYTVEEGPTNLAELQKLLMGRLDLVAAIEEKADQLLIENLALAAKIEKIETPISAKPYFPILSHQFGAKHLELAERIWDAVKEIRETEYLAIYKKYMGE